MEKLSESPTSGQVDESVAKSAANTDTEQSPELRLACSYCLRTLSPQDPNTKLREIVQVENDLYHLLAGRLFYKLIIPTNILSLTLLKSRCR